MDHRQLAEKYQNQLIQAQSQLTEAGGRIFSLESAVADRELELSQLAASSTQTVTRQLQTANARITVLEQALAAQNSAQQQQQQSPEVKMEIDDSTLQQELEVARGRIQDLEAEIAAYNDWLTDFEQKTGFGPAQAVDKILEFKQKLSNATDIESAVRRQRDNYERMAKKAEREKQAAVKKMEEAQSMVQKIKAELWREKNLKGITTSPISFPSTPTPKRKAFDAYGPDQDDDEPNPKVSSKKLSVPSTPQTPQTPLSQRLNKPVKDGLFGRYR